MNRKNLGNIFILLSLSILAFVYYPLINFYLPQPPTPQATLAVTNGFYITIPKINAQAPIILDVDPWNPSIYRQALEQGVAQARGSSLPGEGKTVFLFAHSSEVPWRMTRYNTAFLRLGELQTGNEIVLFKDGQEFKYQVTDKKEVWPKEVQYLKGDQGNQLILQTCTPVGTALKRLLVFAKPV